MPDYLIHAPGCMAHPLDRRHPEVRVGRNPGLEIVLADPTVSWKHARFLWLEDGVFLEDLGSRHGSLVNEARLPGRGPLHPGDRVRLGTVELSLEQLPDPVPPATDTVTLSVPVVHLHGWAGQGAGGLGRAEAMEILHRLSLAMVGGVTPERLLSELLDSVFTFLEASRGAVLLRSPDGGLEVTARRTREDMPDGAIRLSDGVLEALFDRKEALILDAGDTQTGARSRPPSELPTRSIMAVPLETQGEVLGLFYLDASSARGPFTSDEIRFVASLSNLAAARLLHERTARELRRRTDMERQMLALEATLRARGEALAFASHEIRSPLMALLNYVQLALLGDLPAEAASMLQKAERSGQILLGMVNEMLDFAKLEAGAVAVERTPFRLEDVLDVVVDMHAPRAEAKGLWLRRQVAPGIPEPLWGDPLRLGQVLINLVGNAIKFTATGGVSIRVEPEGPTRVRFAVADTGIGITPEQRARIFRPFMQGDPSTARRYGGTGLGLYISSRFVSLLGGELGLQSEPGNGSTFSFSLEIAGTN